MTEPPMVAEPGPLSAAASAAPVQAEEPARQTTPFLVVQFFIFPMAIVAVCVTVFVLFGMLASGTKSPRLLLTEVRNGGGLFNIKRWQAAYALANALESDKDLPRRDPAFVDDLVKLYEETAAGQGDDLLVRRYLALALGRLGDRRAVPALRATLLASPSPRHDAPPAAGGASTVDPGPDTQTVIFAAWALGAIGDPAAVPDLVALAHSPDAGLRKTAVHSLGTFSTDEARRAVAAALQDPAEDVRWNAALHLARQRDPGAAPVLLQMLDRQRLAGMDALTPEQREEAVLQAVEAAAYLSDPGLRAALHRLRENDPALRVREAARAALEREQP